MCPRKMRYDSGMMRTNFIGTVLVIVLGVNLGAWTLSVATNPSVPFASASVPVGAPAMDARSQAASVNISVTPMTATETNTPPPAGDTPATTTSATSSTPTLVQ